MSERNRNRRIKTRPDHGDKVKLGGWLSGRSTYLWIGDEDDNFIGSISGHRLYRLAKAIVRQFESERT